MKILTGDKLRRYLSAVDKGYKERTIKKDLDRYLSSDSGKVMCLYGLRRTGKTVMMQQSMRTLACPDDILLISCDGDAYGEEDMYALGQILDRYEDKKYIFIDEITKLDGFINSSSTLADFYSACGKKVVIAGTDSLGFALARRDELFDRAELIHTTYIPYKEYRRLIGKDTDSYIKYGGTLTDGEKLYNEDRRYGEYTNSAIADNIVHSLEKYGRGTEYDVLRDMVSDHDLSSAIRKVLESHSRNFLQSVIRDGFKSHDKGNLMSNLVKAGIDPKPLKDIADEEIRPYYYIKRDMGWVPEKAAMMIEQYLEELDVVFHDTKSKIYLYKDMADRQMQKKLEDNERFIFVQPGMRYSQSTELTDALLNSDKFDLYTDKQKEVILDKIEEGICGQILEDEIFYHCIRELEHMHVYQIHDNASGSEIDVFIEDPATMRSVALEVKHSDRQASEQWKHLDNDGFVKKVEDRTGTAVMNRAVIYMGENGQNLSGKGLYLNAGDFLCHIPEYIHEMLMQKDIGIEEIKTITGRNTEGDAI